MGFFSWAVLGLIVGVIARVITPGRERIGLVFTIILGVLGAVVGGYVATHFGWGKVSGINLKSLGIATGGAVVVLWVYKRLFR